MNIDWSKAPAHATHWCPGNVRIDAGWIYNPGGNKGEFYSCYADRGLDHIPAFSDWRKARLIPRPPVATWTGEGLPPVGTVCQLVNVESGTEWRDVSENGSKVTIIAHYMNAGTRLAAFTVGMMGQTFTVDSATESYFEPIRTPEQIAAEERSKAIDDLAEELAGYQGCSVRNKHQNLALYLHDNGYRKQVAP